MPDTPVAFDRLGAYSRSDQAWIGAMFAGGGLLLTVLGPILAGWLAEQDLGWVPFGEPLRWIGDLDTGWAWAARIGLGLLGGLVLAMIVITEAWTVEVHDDHLVTVRGDDRRRIEKEAIVGVWIEKKRVIVDGREGRTLFDKEVDAKRDAIREAFVSRGYPFESL